MNEELSRLEDLERQGMLTNASDQNALAELRKKPRKTPAKKTATKKAPVKKATSKKVSGGKAN